MKTNQDVKINFRHYGDITVPKGTRLTHQTAMGIDKKYHFVNEFGWIKRNYPEFHKMMLEYDAEHYGIDIPEEFVDHEV